MIKLISFFKINSMEKRLIRDHEDIQKVIDFYGEEWEDEIREEINMFPTILIACYCDDIEFGEYYQFTWN